MAFACNPPLNFPPATLILSLLLQEDLVGLVWMHSHRGSLAPNVSLVSAKTRSCNSKSGVWLKHLRTYSSDAALMLITLSSFPTGCHLATAYSTDSWSQDIFGQPPASFAASDPLHPLLLGDTHTGAVKLNPKHRRRLAKLVQPGWPLFATRTDPGWLHQFGKRKVQSPAARKVPYILASFPASLRHAGAGNLHPVLHKRRLDQAPVSEDAATTYDQDYVIETNRTPSYSTQGVRSDCSTFAGSEIRLLDFAVGEPLWMDPQPAKHATSSTFPSCADTTLTLAQAAGGQCQELAQEYHKTRLQNHRRCGGSRQEPLCFDFNLVFNLVVLVSNSAVMLACVLSGCGHCSCVGWLSGLALTNLLCPGIVVTLDTLPAELGAYLLIVMAESLLWLIVAALRLREAFEKQSEFVLALMLYSVCTSYVAWSGPALYVELVGASLDARVGVLLTMAMQTCSYALLEKVLAQERARQQEYALYAQGGADAGRSRSGSPERQGLREEVLEACSDLFTLRSGQGRKLPELESAANAIGGREKPQDMEEEGKREEEEDRGEQEMLGGGEHAGEGGGGEGGRREGGGDREGTESERGEERMCAVCAGGLEDEDERVVRRLGWCGHVFHQACIDPWLLRHSARCPLCRRAPEH